jgi:hypothetical protein
VLGVGPALISQAPLIGFEPVIMLGESGLARATSARGDWPRRGRGDIHRRIMRLVVGGGGLNYIYNVYELL